MAPTISVVIYKAEVVAVVHSAEMNLSYGKADTVCKTLTQGTSGDFNAYMQIPVRMRNRGFGKGATIGVVCLWVARGQRVDLSECLKVIQGQFISKQVQQNVL